MANIAVDIDETIYSFDTAFRNTIFDIAEERKDKSILRLAYSNNFEWRNLVDHDKQLAYEAIERIHSNTFKYNIFEDVHETLWRLHESNHKIQYIGSRFDKHHLKTLDWIIDQDLPDGELICANPQKPKNEYLTNCQYLIDDRPKTILDFLYDPNWNGEQRKAFALWRPYNQNLTEVKNLYLAPTWRGLRFYLERKNIIL